jgi:hypothetical protein
LKFLFGLLAIILAAIAYQRHRAGSDPDAV